MLGRRTGREPLSQGFTAWVVEESRDIMAKKLVNFYLLLIKLISFMKFKNSQLKKLMIIINEYCNTPILTTLMCQSLIMSGRMHSICSYILVYLIYCGWLLIVWY